MAYFVISYDLRKQRDYTGLLKQLRDWHCARPLQSVWFGNLTGSASAIRDVLRAHIDGDDGLMIVELKQGSDWATFGTLPGGTEWLQASILA